MSASQAHSLIDQFKIESRISKVDNCELSKAYSTTDGKEVIFHTINIMLWKPEVVRCFLNALKTVRQYKSCILFLEVFGEEISEEEHVLRYVTENITESVSSVYAGIGSVRLSLIRKWLQDLLKGLQDLHSHTKEHPAYIHGRIRLHHLLYFRSTGQVRIGGYYWLTEVQPEANYPQCLWANEDDCIGYYAPEVFSNNQWTAAIDIYALAMCFIHLLSGCPPYGELDDNTFIKQAILTNQPPKGLLCIQSIDESLYTFLRDCLQPVDKRPTAEQLLNHPFLKEDSNVDISLTSPRVQLHPNQVSESNEPLFSKAFKKLLPQVRAPEKEIRLPSSVVSLFQNTEDIPILKSTSQDNESRNDNTAVYHLSMSARKTYVSSASSGIAGESKVTLSRHNSASALTEFACFPVVSNVVCSVLLPCSFIHPHLSGFMKMNLRVTFSPDSLWNQIHAAIQQINNLRASNHLTPLSEEQEWNVEEAVCSAIQQSLFGIKDQQSTFITVYTYLNTILLNKTISLYLPACFVTDDEDSDYFIQVKFPITSKNLPFDEFTSTITASMIHSVDELRKQLEYPVLSEQMRKRLVVETTTNLTLQLCQLIQDTRIHIFQVDSISATVTHYQHVLDKDHYSLLSVYNSSEVIPANSRLVLHVSIPLITTDTTIKSSSLEFKCYYTISKTRDVQDMVFTIISQIESMEITCSEFEKTVLQKNLTDILIKVIGSVKVEETSSEDVTLPTDSVAETASFVNDPILRSVTFDSCPLLLIEEVLIAHCPNLVSITVGDNSFAKAKKWMVIDCPCLECVRVGKHAFVAATFVELISCPSLTALVLDAFCFQNETKADSSFRLADCRSLERLQIEPFALEHFGSICIENCAHLKRIELKDFACCGIEGSKNELTLKNLPALLSIQSGYQCLRYFNCVQIENVTSLVLTDLPSAFQHTCHQVQLTHASLFEEMSRLHPLSYLSPLLPNTIETIFVQAGPSCQEREVVIEEYPNLQEIVMLAGCYPQAIRLTISHCPCLTSLQIEDSCFQGEDGSLAITHCPLLFSIVIGDAMKHFHTCSVTEVPKLAHVRFGCWTLFNQPADTTRQYALSEQCVFSCNALIPENVANRFHHLLTLFAPSLCMIWP